MEVIPVPTFERHNVCLSCGYDLFGQPRSGPCPECGADARESALQEHFLSLPGNVARLRSGVRLLLISSVLCGFCPAVCLLSLWTEGGLVAALLMTGIFAATVITAWKGQGALLAMTAGDDLSPMSQRRRQLGGDFAAAMGLFIVNVTAYVYWWLGDASTSSGETIAAMLAIGFACLAATAHRAARSGALQARIADAALGGRRHGLAGLGWVKAVYETVWLACCALTLFFLSIKSDNGASMFFAFAALFGLMGFAGVWLAMIVVHALFLSRIAHGPRPMRDPASDGLAESDGSRSFRL